LSDLPRSITLRPVRPDDAEFLREVYASTRREELAATGWDSAQQEDFINMQFEAEHQLYPQQYPRATHEIILLDGQPIGRLMVERVEEAIRGVDIALLPEYRSAGYGGLLIRKLLDEATQTGKPFRIQVVKWNRAVRLYQRLGFVQTGESPTHLQMEWRADAPNTSEQSTR
jgi:GNAT superfamily N-acetyltransferase